MATFQSTRLDSKHPLYPYSEVVGVEKYPLSLYSKVAGVTGGHGTAFGQTGGVGSIRSGYGEHLFPYLAISLFQKI